MDALQFQSADTSLLCDLDDAQWKSLLAFSDLAHLTLALAQVPHAGIPSWVEQRLQQNLAETAMRFERVRVSYSEAAGALSAACIPHVVLKGFTQAPEYVTHPRFRAQSDLDLYCPPADIPAAQEALKRLGYRPVRKVQHYRFADHAPTLARPSTWVWKGNVFDPAKPLTIELHFCLWNSEVSRISIPGADTFWERRIRRSIDGLHFPALNSVDHLGYLALHILREVMTGAWMGNHLYELAGFLHRHADDEQFWRKWESDHDAQLRRLEAMVFILAERWFCCAIPPPVRKHIESLPPRLRMWCEWYWAAPLEAKFHPNKDGRLLQFLLSDTWAAKREALVRAVVPSRVARPGDSVVGSELRGGSGKKYVDYIFYVCRRVVMKPLGVAKFLLRALMVCVIPPLARSKASQSTEHDFCGTPVEATKQSR